MRTPKLRSMAVVAGFAGVSLLVAGTASGMVSGQVDAPIATAIQLAQEDPTSRTPPVPAQASEDAGAAAPIEVGHGPIRCDDDGVCASRIKVQAKEQAPPAVAPASPSTPDASTPPAPAITEGQAPESDTKADPAPGKNRDNGAKGKNDTADTGTSSDTSNSKKGPADKRDPGGSEPPAINPDPEPENSDKGSDTWDFEGWRPEHWDTEFSDDWRDDLQDLWNQRPGYEWNPGSWNPGGSLDDKRRDERRTRNR